MLVAIDFELTEGTVDVAGRWTYQWAARRRPCVHPLRAPSGAVLTRDEPDDHPWHHGLWFTVKYVNGENFWEEYDEYGVLRHDDPPAVDTNPDGVTISGGLRWIRPDRETVVIDEQRRLRDVPIDGTAYAIDFSTVVRPRVDVVLDRTPFTTWGGYGGLTLRGAGDWADTRLRLDDGSVHDQIHGEAGRWCDLTGRDGRGHTAGVALFSHPSSPRHPVPWYGSTRADTYGEGWANFLNAAFLWDEPLELAAGEQLAFRYRVLVHDGWDPDRLTAAFDRFARSGGPKQHRDP
jgi:hypothetical protein